MSFDPENISIMHWTSREVHECGYCHSGNAISNGLWAECLTVEDYQDMIDRGWRRSGKYCYKPIMNETCCPQYTIRCDALQFKASKSLKKVIKKLNKFLREGELSDSQSDINPTDGRSTGDAGIPSFSMPNNVKEVGNKVQFNEVNMTGEGSAIINSQKASNTIGDGVKVKPVVEKDTKEFKKGIGPDVTKPQCKKAKFLRMQRREAKKQQNMNAMNIDEDTPGKAKVKNKGEKSLRDLLNEPSSQDKHKLQIKLIGLKGAEWEEHRQVEFNLYKKYQMSIHKDPESKCTQTSFERFLVISPLQIKLVKITTDHESMPETIALYLKYQHIVHADDTCAENFIEFLVDNPFVQSADDPTYGSFHQQYWLDNKLIAVGVIDILPKCVSSVYFFYDPSYRDFVLGTYSALREVEFTQCLHEHHPTIKYYYMGYYIHTCPKMLYKGKFKPSDLLCPETYTWIPIEKCQAKLDIKKYSRFQEDVNIKDEEACLPGHELNDMKIIYNYSACKLRHYKHRQRDAQKFETLGLILGKKLVGSLFIAI